MTLHFSQMVLTLGFTFTSSYFATLAYFAQSSTCILAYLYRYVMRPRLMS